MPKIKKGLDRKVYLIGSRTLLGTQQPIPSSLEDVSYNLLIRDFENFEFSTESAAIKEIRKLQSQKNGTRLYYLLELKNVY